MSTPQPVAAHVTGHLQEPTRVLLVHAHPDDESITTGGTMAALVEAGAHVTLLTATRGEGGEVIGDERLHLEGHRAELAEYRAGELAAAMKELGVTDHRFLGDEPRATEAGGGAGALDGRTGRVLDHRRFEDSGMVWGADGHAAPAPDMVPNALCAAPVETVAAYISAVAREVSPDLVITYGPGGGYGHPDHRRVHEATVLAVKSMAAEAAAGSDAIAADGSPTRGPVLLFQETPADVASAAFDPGQPGFAATGFHAGESSTIPAAAPAEGGADPIAVAQDVRAQLAKKRAAMAAHATQIAVSGDFFALSNGIGQKISTVEYFTVSPDGAVPLGADPAGTAQAGGVPAGTEPAGAAGTAPATASAASADAPFGTRPDAGSADGGTRAPASNVLDLVPRQAAPELSHAGPGRVSKPKIGVAGVLYTLLLSVIVAVLGSLQHLNATAFDLGGQAVVLPWGILLSIALTFVAMWHIASLYRNTMLLVISGLIVSGLSFVFGQPRALPGQDILVFNVARSLVWLFVPMILAVILAFTHPALKAPKRR